MTHATRTSALRARRAHRIHERRRLFGAAGGSAVLGVLCLAAAVFAPTASADTDAVTVADFATAGAQDYGTALVSAVESDRAGGYSATAVDANNPAELKAIAAEMIGAYGWGEADMQCLDLLWEKESNWNPSAENPESGAYGIPQSWPAEKLATAGDDWRTNPITQMTWGMDYIAAVYGTPCAAWNQHGGSY